jgi:hypothetical protein
MLHWQRNCPHSGISIAAKTESRWLAIGDDTFMTVVRNGLIAVLIIRFGVRWVYRRYPDTALVRFKSFDEISAYYRFAFDTLRQHRWLRLIPVLLVLSYYALRIPTFLIGRRVLGAISGAFETYTAPITAGRILGGLAIGGRGLFDGHNAFFLGMSPVTLVLTLVIVLRPRILLKRLSRYAGGQDVPGWAFLEKTLSALHVLMLLTGIPLIVALVLRVPEFAIPLAFANACVWFPSTAILGSVVRGYILFYVKDVARTGRSDRQSALRSSLAVTRPLFYLALILTVPLFIDFLFPMLFRLPLSLSVFMGRTPPQVPLPVAVWLFLDMDWAYIAAGLAAVFVCAPFVLVHGDAGIRQILRSNFRFLGSYFLRYVMFIATGVFLLALPAMFGVFMEAVVPINSLPDLLLDTIVSAVSIYLAVVFLLALFRFYLDFGSIDSR